MEWNSTEIDSKQEVEIIQSVLHYESERQSVSLLDLATRIGSGHEAYVQSMWLGRCNHLGKCLFAVIIIIFIIYLNNYTIEINQNNVISVSTQSSLPLWNQTLDFDKLQYSNETGNPTGCYVVPNYIHYVYLGGTPLNYIELICTLSAFKNQKPAKIFFHYNDKRSLSGKYWNVLEKTPGFLDIVEFNEVELPVEIFGQPISKEWRKWHGSDIVRIQMIMKYGGIFLDNDCYLVKSIDDYRRFEISISWDEDQFLGSQVIVAHKDARFLKKWLECYKVYDGSKWYYNAGERPTVEVLYKKPELIHRVKVLFGTDNMFIQKIFQMQWKNWKTMYVIHLLARHQYLLKSLSEKAKFPVEFNELNIADYPITFRDMAYDVYETATVKWPTEKFA